MMKHVTRRRFLVGTAALAAYGTVPASAATATRFDREVVEFAPNADGGSIMDRFNVLSRMLSNGGGGTIRLTEGEFWTHGQLVVLDNIRVVGRGQDKTLIKLLPDVPTFNRQAGIIRAKRDSVPLPQRFVHNILLERFTVDGNRDAQRQDVSDDEKKYGFYGETRDAVIRFVTTRNCMGYGFDPHGTPDHKPSERMIIEDCHAHGNYKDGFTLDRQLDMLFRRNLAEDNDRAGINVVTTTENTTIEDNITRNNRGTGIFVQNGSHTLTISRNEVLANTLEGIYLRDSNNMIVTQNVIQANGRAGIRVRGGQNVAIEKNEVAGNMTNPKTGQAEVHLDDYKGEGATGVVVFGNTIRTERNSVLRETGGSRRNQVIGNTFRTLAGGIELSSDLSLAQDNVERMY